MPTVLAASLAVPIGNADISCLRYAGGGGSAIPVAVGKALQDKLNIPVVEVYGMTETASVHTVGYLDRPIRLGSVGLAVPYSPTHPRATARYLNVTSSGRQWIANLHSNIFCAERELSLCGPQR